MFKSISIISFLFLFSYIRCESVTQTKVTDSINKDRTGTLFSVDECFKLFIGKGLIILDEKESNLGNLTAVSGSCPKAVKNLENNDPQPQSIEQAEIVFKAAVQLGIKEVKVKIVTEHNINHQTWLIKQATLNDSNQELNLDVEHLSAVTNHSFSCSNLELRKIPDGRKAEGDLKNFHKIIFNDFQIQPFKGERVFMDSYDCTTWFTIGTFAGLLVLILFTTILAIGILYIMNIKTTDRFEDPKGKPLQLGNTDN